MMCEAPALAQDSEAPVVYADMVRQVQAFHGLRNPGLLAQPPKIVIAERPAKGLLSQRVLTNAREVARALEERGFTAQVWPLCGSCIFRIAVMILQGAFAA